MNFAQGQIPSSSTSLSPNSSGPGAWIGEMDSNGVILQIPSSSTLVYRYSF